MKLIVETSQRRADLESTIRRGIDTFVDVGLALLAIRDERLYRETHDTFELYCSDVWGWTRRRANQLIGAAGVVQNLGTMVPISGISERAIRPLVGLPPEEQQEIIERAIEIVGGASPDSHTVQRLVDERHRNAKAPHIQSRRTPMWLFDQINQRFGPFLLDAFADKNNALCDEFYTREQDGCVQPWVDATFGNPEFENMAPPLSQAVKQAELGVRSCIIGPVGCSQVWYHELAIRGTVYVPDRRINFDMPDGTPTDGSDRDTIVMLFGGEHENKHYKRGTFRVCRLELSR